MTHKSIPLPVAGRNVRLVNLNNRLYVPLRFLIEELDMSWSGQKKRLLGMTERWKLADLLVTGNRRSTQQPCLPVALVTPYLWSLRPHNPETRAALERLRDQWEPALFAYLRFGTGELANVGGFLITEIERSLLPLVKECEDLKKAVGDLKKREAEATSAEYGRIAQKRWDKKQIEKSVFLGIAARNNEGKTNSEIARETGLSRTTVSLFLDGHYRSATAQAARQELLAAGWAKTHHNKNAAQEGRYVSMQRA